MIREFILRATGMRKYVTSLQIANEHLASTNQRLGKEKAELEHSLNEHKANEKSLYDHNKELQINIDSLNSVNKKLSEMCNSYNEQCAKFTSEINQLRGRIGGLTKKLNNVKA